LLADPGADGAGDPHDHLPGRQLARIGRDSLHVALAGAVDESFGPDQFDASEDWR
jgi:hypothetical protein